MNENENKTSVCEMKSWVKKARMFRTNAKDNVQQDIRKFGTLRQQCKVKYEMMYVE